MLSLASLSMLGISPTAQEYLKERAEKDKGHTENITRPTRTPNIHESLKKGAKNHRRPQGRWKEINEQFLLIEYRQLKILNLQ